MLITLKHVKSSLKPAVRKHLFDFFCAAFVQSSLCLCMQRETAAGENSLVAGGDGTEQPRLHTNQEETMSDPPGSLTEHQSNTALLALHSSVLSS